MSATFKDSSQFWNRLPAIDLRPTVKSAKSLGSFRDDMVSFTSLVTLVVMITYLVIR